MIERIIQGCKEGNRKCQEDLVHTFAPSLMATCIRYTGDHGYAKDALQETFISVFKNIAAYRGDGSFEGWVKRIAIRKSIDIQKKYKNFTLISLEDENIPMQVELPEVYQNYSIEECKKIVNKLSGNFYLVFNLYVIEGYAHSEIADMLHINENTSRATLSKARTKLIELLSKEIPNKDFWALAY
jgi:RNA polymerase sigma factor (sigma-70 family)